MNKSQEYNVILATDFEYIKKCFSLMKELRAHLSLEDFLQLYQNANEKDQYSIVTIEIEKQIVALMGYRILYDFVHGKHLYIDDLVTSEKFRSKGLGAILLKYADSVAIENKCKGIRLCTGIENEKGKKFYLHNGMKERAVVFKKAISK